MFESYYSIGPRERRSVACLFSFGFGSAASYVLARTIADSAYLSHFGGDHLASLFMVSAGVVALSSLIYGRLVQQYALRTVVLSSLLALAISSLVMPWIMGHFARSLTVFAFAYLLAQIRGSIGTIQFATIFNELFGHDKPERVVGLVGAGATIAGIVTGLGIGVAADHVNVEALMYLTAGVDLLTMLPIIALPRGGPVSGEQAVPDLPPPAQPLRFRDALRNPYVLGITALVMSSVVVGTLIEFEWKVTAAEQLDRNEEALAAYFGYFYGVVDLVTGVTLLLVTSRVLRSRGILVGLLAFPAGLLVSVLATWGLSGERLLLWPMTLSKGCDTFKRSLTNPAIQLAYGPLEHHLRRQAIAFVAGVAKPFAEALAAIALLTLTPWLSGRQLLAVVICLTAVWVMLSVTVYRGYAQRQTGTI
ncbi:MAG: MFS transporter [Planctomycetales bacterium]|nr:MFS transporter [Planctomycetales bacterium]